MSASQTAWSWSTAESGKALPCVGAAAQAAASLEAVVPVWLHDGALWLWLAPFFFFFFEGFPFLQQLVLSVLLSLWVFVGLLASPLAWPYPSALALLSALALVTET